MQKSQLISTIFLVLYAWTMFLVPNHSILAESPKNSALRLSPVYTQKPPSARTNFLDDFEYNTTHPNWTLVKKTGDICLSYPYINLTTFSGGNQDWWAGTFNAPYCYVTLPTGDFVMTTRLLNPGDVPNNSHVGLLLYENDTNAYFFGRRWAGTGNGVDIEGIKANSGQYLAYDYSGTITVQYYRITRNGMTYNFEFSHDGARWLTLVNYTAATLGFTPHYGGLVNKKSQSPAGFSAYFEYFYLYDNHLEVSQQTKTGFYDATWNFENDQVGNLAAGWVTFNSPAQGTVKLVENWYSHNHVLEVNDTGSAAGVGAYRMLGATISSGFIEYWVYLKSNSNCGLVDGCFGNASEYTSCAFRLHRANGRWYASESDTGIAASINVWHRVQISFASSGINYTVDGTVVATRKWLNGLTCIDRISIDSGSSAIANEAYYDAFGLSWQGYVASSNKYEVGIPANWSYYLGSTGNVIKWMITDILAPTPTYTIFGDGVLIQAGSWVSGTPISYNVDGLGVGVYNFTIVVGDGAGELASNQVIITVAVNQAPIINAIEDTGFEACSAWRNIQWNISDDGISSPTFVVKKDSVDYTSGVWFSGIPITINLDSLPVGQYNLTIVAADGLGKSSQDEINVTIAYNLPPRFSNPPDTVIEFKERNSWINWTILDGNVSVGAYSLYCNGTLNATGTWVTGAKVAVNLTFFGLGHHNLTLVAVDGWGTTSQDEVWVDVRQDAFEGFALVIGINDYPGTDNDLTCCVADTNGMYDMLG